MRHRKINTVLHPCNILTFKLGAPKDYIKACIDKLYEIGDECNNETNIQGIMTNYCIWEKYPIFHLLIEKIYEKIIKDPSNEYLFEKMHGDILIPKITNCWGAIYLKDHFAFPHIHLPSLYSFVYYLQTDNNSSPLVFDQAGFEIQPESDLLIGFPAYLEHSVPKSQSDKDRIVMAGNIDMIDVAQIKKEKIKYCWYY